MHKDSIKPGQKVVLIDDLIATGGTIEAAVKDWWNLSGGEVVKNYFPDGTGWSEAEEKKLNKRTTVRQCVSGYEGQLMTSSARQP